MRNNQFNSQTSTSFRRKFDWEPILIGLFMIVSLVFGVGHSVFGFGFGFLTTAGDVEAEMVERGYVVESVRLDRIALFEVCSWVSDDEEWDHWDVVVIENGLSVELDICTHDGYLLFGEEFRIKESGL